MVSFQGRVANQSRRPPEPPALELDMGCSICNALATGCWRRFQYKAQSRSSLLRHSVLVLHSQGPSAILEFC
ncbi:hypothetical protein ILYODFUR_026109 [Ilyodon furcidens]|uniref:Uncharacterized protein n=1 Tax=Ilyodon furcidens TaxID=33524 RepID=A0ABV0UX37_9TELE